MKTYEAPLKQDWPRAEYIEAQKKMRSLERRPVTPFTSAIFCSHCKKEILSQMIHVVNFGKDVACDTCFGKRWAKLRNRIAKFQVPKALEENFEQLPDSKEFQEQQRQDLNETKRASDECVTRIRRSNPNN